MTEEGWHQTLEATEPEDEHWGGTPEPTSRTDSTILGNIVLAHDVDETHGRARARELQVTDISSGNESIVVVGRHSLAAIKERRPEDIPAFINRLITDGRDVQSFRHLETFDENRAGPEQWGSKLIAVLWFQRNAATGQISCSVRAAKPVVAGSHRHLIVNPDGVITLIKDDEWQELCSGAVLHFVPRADGREYEVFKYVVSLPSNVTAKLAPTSGPPHCLRGVLSNEFIGRVIGPQQQILKGIMKQTRSEICFTDFGAYHPAACVSQGRVFVVEGPSRSLTVQATRVLIEAACAVRETAEGVQRPGLDLQQHGLELVVPDAQAGIMLGGGKGLVDLIQDCGLERLGFNPREATVKGERLLRAHGNIDAITALCDRVAGILGPAPSHYDLSLEYDRKRKEPEQPDGTPQDVRTKSGHGKQIKGSEKAVRHDRNVRNKQKQVKSKKQRREDIKQRDDRAAQDKKDFKRWKLEGRQGGPGEPSRGGGGRGHGGRGIGWSDGGGGHGGHGGGGGGSVGGAVGGGTETLKCDECPNTFIFSAADKKEYAKLNFVPPVRCPSCRARRKAPGGYRGRGGRKH